MTPDPIAPLGTPGAPFPLQIWLRHPFATTIAAWREIHSTRTGAAFDPRIAGGLCLAAGLLAKAAGRTTAVLVGRTCPRCGRRVTHGRVYCEEHLKETIDEYRDQQRESGH